MRTFVSQLLLLSVASWVVGCNPELTRGIKDRSDPNTPRAASKSDVAPDSIRGVTMVAVGDVVACYKGDDEATSRLADEIPGIVALLGDNVYESGSGKEYNDCFQPSWGRHKARTRPAAGNHEYNTRGAKGYFDYFGSAAGERGKGYYSYDVGGWHVVVLNSNIERGANSPQIQWLRADLAKHTTEACTLAYWHHPRFSSADKHGNDPTQSEFWEVLYAGGADVVLNGHDHAYERFAPQASSGGFDPQFGIREFVVGTGGRSHYKASSLEPHSEAFNSTAYGVLKLTLFPSAYRWEFVPVAGQSFTDSGASACHAAPASTATNASLPLDATGLGD